MRVFSFHGGIHPPENKKQSTRADIGFAGVPDQLVIPTQQHLGLASDPIVSVGDKVLKGQMIAAPVGRISAALHAPTSGTIIEISHQPVPHASGLEAECIVLASDGEDRWIDHQGFEDFTQVDKEELIQFIRDQGIAGMGGAGFPTDVKLHLPHDHIVNTLILNAAECEPYITADDMLMREHADEVIRGAEIMAYLLGPSHVLIGIEDNKPNAIRTLTEAIKHSELNIDLVVVPTKYPSGGERQLIQLLTGVEVPSGKIPADVGIVVQNVGTAAAVHRAVDLGEPLIDRIVTVTGDALVHPQNLRALIGTPFRTLLEQCEIRDEYVSRLVMGGPMMGVTVESQQIPVIKTTNCLIAATEQEFPPAPPAQPCIRCGMCEQACPAQLLPQQLYWFAKGREFDKAKNHNLFDCIECGACAYVCPSNIPLVQYYRFAKSEIRSEELEQRKADHARQRFEARKARLEREAELKAQRRKEKAQKAAKQQAERRTEETQESASNAPDPAALKTAAAVARTKLKKAQKALDQAIERGIDELQRSQLEQALNEARTRADAAQQALDKGFAPSQDAGQSGTAAELKSLKTAAALARTQVKKAEEALSKAEEKGLDGLEKLRETLLRLRDKAQHAEAAFTNAQNNAASSKQEVASLSEAAVAPEIIAAPEKRAAPDLKALKQQVSIMRTKLKKAQSSRIEGEDNPELEQEIAQLEARFVQAQEALDAAEAGLIASAQAKGVDLKALRKEAALAKAQVTKQERALSRLDNEDERDALENKLTEARSTSEQLEAQLAEIEGSA